MNLVLKQSPLNKRIKELEKELNQVDGTIRTLTKSVDRTRAGKPPVQTLPPLVDPSAEESAAPAPAGAWPDAAAKDASRNQVRDERFVGYLASSLEPVHRPLKHERSVQRNKAIFTICLVVILLVVILRHVFL